MDADTPRCEGIQRLPAPGTGLHYRLGHIEETVEYATPGLNPHSVNRPTPDPSQEGSRHRSASFMFPSWEGLGVGSWLRVSPAPRFISMRMLSHSKGATRQGCEICLVVLRTRLENVVGQ